MVSIDFCPLASLVCEEMSPVLFIGELLKARFTTKNIKKPFLKNFFKLFDFLSISSPYFQNVHCFLFVFSCMKTMTILMARKNIFFPHFSRKPFSESSIISL